MEEKFGWKAGPSAAGLLVFSLAIDEFAGPAARAPLYALAAVTLHAVQLIPSKEPEQPLGDQTVPFLMAFAALLSAQNWAAGQLGEDNWLKITAHVMALVAITAMGYAAYRLVKQYEARREGEPLDKSEGEPIQTDADNHSSLHPVRSAGLLATLRGLTFRLAFLHRGLHEAIITLRRGLR